MSDDKPGIQPKQPLADFPEDGSQPEQPPAQDADRRSSRVPTAVEAKDVLTFTLDRLKEESEKSMAALKDSTERLLNESEAARDMVRRLTQPPPEK